MEERWSRREVAGGRSRGCVCGGNGRAVQKVMVYNYLSEVGRGNARARERAARGERKHLHSKTFSGHRI